MYVFFFPILNLSCAIFLLHIIANFRFIAAPPRKIPLRYQHVTYVCCCSSGMIRNTWFLRKIKTFVFIVRFISSTKADKKIFWNFSKKLFFSLHSSFWPLNGTRCRKRIDKTWGIFGSEKIFFIFNKKNDERQVKSHCELLINVWIF